MSHDAVFRRLIAGAGLLAAVSTSSGAAGTVELAVDLEAPVGIVGGTITVTPRVQSRFVSASSQRDLRGSIGRWLTVTFTDAERGDVYHLDRDSHLERLEPSDAQDFAAQVEIATRVWTGLGGRTVVRRDDGTTIARLPPGRYRIEARLNTTADAATLALTPVDVRSRPTGMTVKALDSRSPPGATRDEMLQRALPVACELARPLASGEAGRGSVILLRALGDVAVGLTPLDTPLSRGTDGGTAVLMGSGFPDTSAAACPWRLHASLEDARRELLPGDGPVVRLSVPSANALATTPDDLYGVSITTCPMLAGCEQWDGGTRQYWLPLAVDDDGAISVGAPSEIVTEEP